MATCGYSGLELAHNRRRGVMLEAYGKEQFKFRSSLFEECP